LNRVDNSFFDLVVGQRDNRIKARSSNEASIYYLHNLSDFNKEKVLTYNVLDYTVFLKSVEKKDVGLVQVFEGLFNQKALLYISLEELFLFNNHFLFFFFEFFDFV
jgi:hypothetical protein